MTNRESFQRLKDFWVKHYFNEGPFNQGLSSLIVVATKSDLQD